MPQAAAFALAAALMLEFGIAPSGATGWQANNVWWEIVRDWSSGQLVCVAENLNPNPLNARFDVFPDRFDNDGRPLHGKTMLSMRPHIQYRVFGWLDGSRPAPRCELEAVG
jgi:hypothetical protein